MTIKEFKKLLYDAKIEIDNEDFEMLWQGTTNNKKLDGFDDYEIIDITTNAGFILIRINKEQK